MCARMQKGMSISVSASVGRLDKMIQVLGRWQGQPSGAPSHSVVTVLDLFGVEEFAVGLSSEVKNLLVGCNDLDVTSEGGCRIMTAFFHEFVQTHN